MKMFKQILVFTLMFLTQAGCGSDDGASTATTEELVLLDVVTLTSDTETGIEARPEIFFYNDRFFFVYLYAPVASTREHRVRIYDAGLSTVLADSMVSENTTDYGSPTDIRGTQAGGTVYLAYESLKAPPNADKETYVFLSAHNLDVSFSVAAPTGNGSVLLASAIDDGSGINEVLADPTVYVKDGSLVLLTNIVTGPTSDAIHYLREFNASDLAIIEPGREINLGNLGILGMGGVSNLFDNNGVTTGIFRHMADPAATWEFKLVAFDDNFLPIADSVKTIADQGLNFYPSGFLAWNNGYLLAHSNKDTFTTPVEGEEQREIWLKWFSQDFELLQAIKLDDLGIHPTLATDGDKLYLAYSSGGKLKVAIFSVAQI